MSEKLDNEKKGNKKEIKRNDYKGKNDEETLRIIGGISRNINKRFEEEER